MFKSFLYSLDKPPQDELLRRIEREKVSDKYFTAMGGTIIASLAVMVVGVLGIFIYNNQIQVPPITYSVKKLADGQYEQNQIISLPEPSQNVNNVTKWLKEALMLTYSFSFLNYDKVVDESYYYFTSDGYTTYKNSLNASKIKEVLDDKLMQVSLVPISEPILVKGVVVNGVARWVFRTEVIVNYTTGSQSIDEKYVIETLIVKVPPYKSVKGLGIAQYNMLKK
jgi:hypothetical protein